MGKVYYNLRTHEQGSYNIIANKFKVLFIGLLSALFLFLATGLANAYTFPSTNDDNRTNGHPHVNLLSNDIDEVTLEFINETNSLAFFEYRIDGVSAGSTPHPVVTGSTIHSGIGVDNRSTASPQVSSKTETFTANEKIEIRLALGGERDWDFDWTTFNVLDPDPTNSHQYNISGNIYRDVALNDCDNKSECENRAERLPDWEARLYKENSSSEWELIDTDITDVDGIYKFATQYEAGVYHVCEVLKPGWTQQKQTWGGSGYRVDTDNLSGDLSVGPYCNTLSYDDTGDRSHKSHIGNVDTQKPDITITDPASGSIVKQVLVDASITDNYELDRFNINLNKVGDSNWNFTTQPQDATGQSNVNLTDFDLLAAAYYGTCDGHSPCASWSGGEELPDGEYKIRINAWDRSGNLKAYAHNFTIDNTASDGAFISPTSLDIAKDEFTVEVEISDPSGLGSQQIVMRDTGGSVAGNWSYNVKTGASNTISGASGTFSYIGNDFSGNLKITFNTNDLPSDGQYNLRLFTKDILGNGRSNIYSSMLVDNTAPGIDISNVNVSEDKKLSFDLLATDNGPSGLQIVAANIYDETNTNKLIELGSGSPTRLNTPHSGFPVGTPSFPTTLNDVDVSLLTPGIYTIRAYAKDHATNELRFKLVPFTVFPVISNETSTNSAITSVTIEWDTDHPTTSRVIYDDEPHSEPLGSSMVDGYEAYGYEFTTEETDTSPKVTEHSVIVTGLTPGTTYYFRTVSHGSPESVSSEIIASTTNTPQQSSSNSNPPNNTSGNPSNVGGFTAFNNVAANFGALPAQQFVVFGQGNPGAVNGANDNNQNNNGNDNEDEGEVAGEGAGVSSASTTNEENLGGGLSFSWWWLLALLAPFTLYLFHRSKVGQED